jgi:hypothetical protein
VTITSAIPGRQSSDAHQGRTGRPRARQVLAGAALALAATGPAVVAAAPAQAAAGSDLDLTRCQIVDDPIDYQDGIDWFKVLYTITNEGTAATGGFTSRARPVYGTDEFSGTTQNEGSVRFSQSSLAPGQSTSGFFWVTKKTVDNRTWGIFLDINKQTGESQVNDSFCSAFVNNT